MIKYYNDQKKQNQGIINGWQPISDGCIFKSRHWLNGYEKPQSEDNC